jgi:dipeptidyl aminopeptidase/acylaminoacyl peptidase
VTEPCKLTLDDLWNFKELGNIALSPDGSRVAFVMYSIDRAKNESRSAIFLLRLDEQGQAIGEPRQLTSGSKRDTEPTWAPDSQRLLFLSNREGDKKQLWLLNTDGGEARKLTSMLHGVDEASWSPDGQWIAFTAAMASTDDDDVLMGRKQLDEAAKKRYEEDDRFHLRTITTINYRLDGRGLYEKFSQLFVMPAPATDEALDAASIRRLTAGEYDHTQPIWTPDSQEIGVLCNRADDRDYSYVSDLWAIERANGEARRLTDGTLQIQRYAWSPDGQTAVLVAAYDLRVAGHCNPHLYLVTREGGPIQALTEGEQDFAAASAGGDYGRPGPHRPCWSSDGQRVYFLQSEHGRVNVQCLDVQQKAVTPVTNADILIGFHALLPGERALLIAQEDDAHPWELYLLPLTAENNATPERLTHLYDRQMAQFLWSRPERIRYRGANDEEIDGWIMLPIGARAGVKYPLMVTIHGGPQGAYSAGTGLGRFCQYFAAQGFAVFYCNPHGSTGYGQAFMREVEDDNCGWDYQDIMRGVDECIARGIADPERLVVTGYSYGGQMSMFIVTQTDRFKAAVPRAGISNLVSFVGTSDVGYLTTVESKGYPWNPQRAGYYRDRSAMTHITRVTTPTLLIHPENDYRCPIEQSEQFYMALKMIGKAPVEFVRIPGAWHGGMPRPSQWIAHWERIAEWFHKYVEIRPDEYD